MSADYPFAGDTGEIIEDPCPGCGQHHPLHLDCDGQPLVDCCGECFEEFRLDDTGGYNPPCRCGFMCRDCCGDARHRHCLRDLDDNSDDFDSADPDEADPNMPGWMP